MRPALAPGSLGPRLLLACGCLLAVCRAARGGDVPVRVEARVVFVQATVNGKGPFTLIVDTGATETVLTPPTAAALRISGIPVSGSQQVGQAASVRVGDAEVRDFPVYIFDPPQALSLRLDHGVNYQGILGQSFLSRFRVTLDYALNTLRLEPYPERAKGRPTRAPAPDGQRVPFEMVEGLIHVTGSINGQGPLRFLVDTGSAEVLIMPRVAMTLKLPAKSAEEGGIFFTTLDRLALGESEVTTVPAILHRLARDRSRAPTYDGIVGHPFLSAFAVTIDYRECALYLRPVAR